MSVFRVALCSAVVLGGCADFSGRIAPDLPVDALIDHVQCQMRIAYLEARKKDADWLENWVANFTISIQKEDETGLNPRVSYSTPIDAGVFSASASADISRKTVRNLLVARDLFLSKLETYDCQPRLAHSSPLLGNLGLKEALHDAVASRGQNDVIEARPTKIGYTAEFVLSYGGSAGPAWKFTRITDLGVAASASRAMIYKIDFAFSEIKGGVMQPAKRGGRPRAPQTVTPETRQNLNETLFDLQLRTLQRLR